MTDHNELELADMLQESLEKIEAGYTIEEVLAAAPEQAGELRPLLETAAAARRQHDPAVPVAARHRSRTRALVHAQRLRSAPRGRFSSLNLRRLVMQLGAFALILAVSLTSLVAASAQSLPGDNLYVIKRAAESARLNSSNARARAGFVESLRVRRVDEIEELMRLHRAAPVNFEGVVTETGTGAWRIAGLSVSIRTDTEITGDILPGMFVEVFGRTLSTGELTADRVFLRAYAFSGRLDARNGSIWLIDGTPVLITESTQLAPGIQTGDVVVILAQVDDEGTISARAVLAGQEALPDEAQQTPEPTRTVSPAPTVTETETQTPAPEADPEAVETEDEMETGTESSEDTDDPDEETEEPEVEDETEEPEETEEETEEPEETEKSTETEEPTETDEPDDD